MVRSVERLTSLPTVYALHAPRPSLSRDVAELRLDLPEPVHVHLAVHDVLGREVACPADGALVPGTYRRRLDAGLAPRVRLDARGAAAPSRPASASPSGAEVSPVAN